MTDESTLMVIIANSELAPDSPKTDDTEACWRCAGTGKVTLTDGEQTPCGACLGTKVPPKPCPKCKSRKVKIATDFSSDFWRCRDCGYRGPEALRDTEAYRLWQEHIKDA